ncbi:MAG TPA: kinase [Sphingomicrobium sp.]|nr:kinase [Sphingomicrobium sp.]
MPVETILVDAIRRRLTTWPRKPLVVGLCGAQGSGKSTVSAALTANFKGSVTFSIDDLYLGRAARSALAKRIHPLLATRGVPGTHDPMLGVEVLDTLKRGRSVAIPHFDKASDDRVPCEEWSHVEPGCELVIFEGWCVGARPQEAVDLVAPVNALEAEEDSDGRWRRFVNDELAGAYQQLFSCIDMLVLLAAPSWETILGWRLQQEHELSAERPNGAGVMDDHQVARFVSHYERLTRHILAEMPGRADVLVYLNQSRECVGAEYRP